MDLESAQNNIVAKLPLLKQGDYKMWNLRIEQYFQVQDYALWDVIENGNSFNPVPRITTNTDELEKKVMLVNNMLGEMTRYLQQMRTRAQEEKKVHSLPLDQPLNSYGLYTLIMTSDFDRRVTDALKAAREEVMKSINEKQQLISNYRAI
uniref:Ribonuclease H-like domain-containing protein n=1 Tax=Tanacetum cinerariifolium TaxID=118510 RepID=A0A699H5I9_TANCI|nr:ribonuclease H-like domain-containing protein [Tanacetum cinerariifolium]